MPEQVTCYTLFLLGDEWRYLSFEMPCQIAVSAFSPGIGLFIFTPVEYALQEQIIF
jgi:hypothetical protein